MSLTKEKHLKPPCIRHLSPNFNNRPQGTILDSIIIHYTALPDTKTSLQWLTDPVKEVSAHYLICRSGKLYQLVNDEKRAWHAGISEWKNHNNINNSSLGIELDHDGSPSIKYPDHQIHILIQLLSYLCENYAIPKENVIGHCDIAPLRKQDPGSFFPWHELYLHGFGIPPQPLPLFNDIFEMQQFLKKIGYGVALTGKADDLTQACIKAYRSHLSHVN